MRFVIFCLMVCVLGCGPEPGPGPGSGGDGGSQSTTSSDVGGSGGSTSTMLCAEWMIPIGPQPSICPDESARCADFGAMTTPVCCPPGEPCSAPAPAPTDCLPMLGTFLGWCCLPACPAQKVIPHACGWGWTDCDGDAANGCETSVYIDVDNCGQCGHQCSFPNSIPKCTEAGCGMDSCYIGYQDCDTNPINGCETNVLNDPNNCGACAEKCPPDWTCVSSVCTAPY